MKHFDTQRLLDHAGAHRGALWAWHPVPDFLCVLVVATKGVPVVRAVSRHKSPNQFRGLFIHKIAGEAV
jgi:hypothetical protein